MTNNNDNILNLNCVHHDVTQFKHQFVVKNGALSGDVFCCPSDAVSPNVWAVVHVLDKRFIKGRKAD